MSEVMLENLDQAAGSSLQPQPEAKAGIGELNQQMVSASLSFSQMFREKEKFCPKVQKLYLLTSLDKHNEIS